MLVVQYQHPDEMKVDRQADVVARLEAKPGTVLVFDVGAGVRSVPLDVPTFWLGVTARAELQIHAMAIVTMSAAVRVAAKGFALANTVRGVGTEVRTFETIDDANAWARAQLNPAGA